MNRAHPARKGMPGLDAFFLMLVITLLVPAQAAMAQPRKIVAGVMENWPPQYTTDPQTRQPSGFAIDIMNAVGQLSGIEISYVPFKEWPALNRALVEKKIDVIPNMGIISERESYFNYTVPVETTKILFFVRETSNDINSQKDLLGRPVSVVETNKGRFLLEAQGWPDLKVYQSFDEALMSMIAGVSDAFVYPDPPFMNIVTQYGLQDRVKAIGAPLLEVKRAIAVHRDDLELIRTLDASLIKLMSSPEYGRIYTKWHGGTPPFWSAQTVALVMGAFLFAMGISLLVWRYFSILKLNRELIAQTEKRRQTEEVLRENEERFRAIALSTPDHILIQGTDLRYEWVLNPQLGLTEREMIGKTDFDFLPPQEAQKLTQIKRDVLDSGSPKFVEVPLISTTGQVEYFRGAYVPKRNLQDEITGLIGYFRNVTSAVKSEAALRASEQQYRSLFANMRNGYAYCRMLFHQGAPVDFVYLDVNRAFESLTGLKDVAGKKASEVIPGIQTSDPALIETYGRVATTGTPEAFEIFLTSLSMWFSLSVYSPEKQHFVAIFDVITERKIAEETLRNSERRLKLAQQSAGAGVWDWDIATAGLDWSPELFALFGRDPEKEAASFELWDRLLHPDDKALAYRKVDEAIETRTSLDSEYRIIFPNGQIRWIKALGNTVYDDAGAPVRMAGICIDITERMRAQEERASLEARLLQAQKLQAVGTLAGGIAHDFNNILSSVIGFSELALDDIPAGTLLHDHLSEVLNAGKRARDLVKQILTFSRKSTQQKLPLRIDTVILRNIRMVRATIPTSITIRENLCDQSLIVTANESQMNQVIVNLITNAAHAVDENGMIQVGLESVILDSAMVGRYPELSPGDYAKISVSDNGHGISEEHMGFIFDPYFTTKDPDKGSGLGLAVVHGIVKIHDGHIAVSSTPGQGTTVDIYLPLGKKSPRAEPEPQHKSLPLGTERVLLVDDEPSIVKMQKQNLERLGYTVTGRTDSREALETFQSAPDSFDLVITDMTMPKMTGDRLSAALKKLRPDVPVILCTGFSEKINAKTRPELPVDRVLMKPVDIDTMASTIRWLLNVDNR